MKLLCVVSQPPYRNSHDFELVEVAMVAAAFDLPVGILFRDEGVWSLLPDQDGSSIGRKTLSKTLAALGTYEVDRIYACADSLSARGMQARELCIDVEVLDHAAQAELIGAHDAVVIAQA